ncbi:calmodulin-binding transcription activator 3-like isoform X2 [Mangifera indica]|uniref:calmodulin-binding transcription activator 3-like isoform X2 n=1 Tax=Mangifera indica TaxID=29780 RepID=UPI001CF97A36|nr:calmodulin-binding transcription activator 3-like isoform X2 [Mangifera indica]
MELSARRLPVEQNVEQIVKEAQHRWLNAAEICKIIENHEKLQILAFQPQQRPTSGSFFVIKLRGLRKFRNDGHVWSKKKDGKTIQESHENLKVNGVAKLNCLYAYLETNTNFQRRIYRLIEKEHDVAIFHYREDKENRKKTTKVSHQSSLEARKAIPTLVVTGSQGSSSGTVDNGSNQLPLPLQTTDTSNLENIQGNVESAGGSSGIVNHGNYQLPLAPKTTDSINQNFSNQPSSGFHSIPDLQRNLTQITDAEFSGSHNLVSFTGDGAPHYVCECQNLPSSQETENDFPPNPGTISSPCELPESEKSADQVSEKNKDNLKLVSDIPAELLAKTSTGYQDCMIFQENPNWQESRKNCKRSKNLNILDITGSLSGIVHHESYQLALSSQTIYTSNLSNIQGYSGSGDGMPEYENLIFHRVIESDFPPNPGITGTPCELLELESLEQFPEGSNLIVDSIDNFGDITTKSLHKRFEDLLSLNCHNSNIIEISLEKKFHLWLKKLGEGGSELTVLDVKVIHLIAALGYTLTLQQIFGAIKIDINLSDKDGYTALHWAAKYGRMRTVEFLICQGANPVLPSFPKGSTPGLDSVTGTLVDLDFGIDTPASLAYNAGHDAVGRYLEKKAKAVQAALTFDDDDDDDDEFL